MEQYIKRMRVARRILFSTAAVVLGAGGRQRDHYARLLDSRKIQLIGCSLPVASDQVMADDGDPDRRGHRLYAESIERALAARRRCI